MTKGEKKSSFFQEDENEARGNWTGKADFLLSAIGFAVGLGNVWRFPFKAYSNGGASFLIPYVIMLIFCGLPLFFMEMALGQFSSLGPISVWRAVPFFKGLGWAMVIISGLVAIYYNMIIAYTLYYLFASFTSKLPWQECREEWTDCATREQSPEERNATAQLCAFMVNTGYDKAAPTNYSNICEQRSASEIYWFDEVLEISDNISEGASEIKWELALCLLLAWIIIFVCLSKGIKSSGKVVYVTATFPYIVLVILCIRNAFLPGAIDGIKFYIIPKWERLLDGKVWYDAATQIFYSLGVAFGGLEVMASYNRFNNNVHRDAIVVAILNCGTSVFAGFVIFSVIGFMAHETGQDVANAVDSGPGLAFIAYPEGLAMMPIAPLWSILFFLMLFTLGLDSQFAMMETVISALYDEFPIFQKGNRKTYLTLFLCVFLFALGLPQCAKNGFYIMNLFDWYSAGFSLMIVGLLEVIAISWIYGFKRFSDDIHMMLGFKPNLYWIVNWLVITPLMMVFTIAFSIYSYTPISIRDYQYEDWAAGIGLGMVGLALVFIPLCAIIEYCKSHGFVVTMTKTLIPYQIWGPALPKHRSGRYNPDDIPDPNKKHGHPNPAYEP